MFHREHPLPQPAVCALCSSHLAAPAFTGSLHNLEISLVRKDPTVDLAEDFWRQLFGIGTEFTPVPCAAVLCCAGLALYLCLQGRGLLQSPEQPMAPRNQAGLVGWMFCLITGIYLKVFDPAACTFSESQVSTYICCVYLSLQFSKKSIFLVFFCSWFSSLFKSPYVSQLS